MKKITLLLPALLFSISTMAEPETETKTEFKRLSKQLNVIEMPKPIVRVAPKYPMKAARNGMEGWTTASFVIDTQGAVKDIVILDNAGSRDFIRESKRALKKWKYKPAIENGEPIEQCNNTVRLDYKMDGGGNVTRQFLGLYKKAREGFDKKDNALIEETFNEIRNRKSLNSTEHSYFALLKAEYAKLNNLPKVQLQNIYRIDFSSMSEKTKLFWLHQQFVLEYQANKFVNALNTYKDLTKLEEAKPFLEQLQATHSELLDIINSASGIEINAKVSKQGTWLHKLARNDFSITNIQGTVHKLEVRCANKYHTFTVVEDNTWKIPKNWRGCSVMAFSDNQASFDLIEHPFENENIAITQ